MKAVRARALKSRKFTFGPTESFLLFGGGRLLLELARNIQQAGQRVAVITSPRHANAEVDVETGGTLVKCLDKLGIEHRVTTSLRVDKSWQELVHPTTLGISISAEWIFGADEITFMKNRLVNLHGTFLPDFKGGGGPSWNLMMRYRGGGSTLHFVDQGIDTGALIVRKRFTYPSTLHTPSECLEFSNGKHRKMLNSFIARVMKKDIFVSTPQDETRVGSYWPRLSTDVHGYIDWGWQAKEIVSFTEAFSDPYRGAVTYLNGRKVRILRATETNSRHVFHPFQRGLIYEVKSSGILIATAGGGITAAAITDDESGAALSKGLLGNRLHTPQNELDVALSTRVSFRPDK